MNAGEVAKGENTVQGWTEMNETEIQGAGKRHDLMMKSEPSKKWDVFFRHTKR